LSSYSFSKYKKKKDDYIPHEIFVADDAVSAEQINELINNTEAAFHSRNLINEPLSYLTAERFSK